MDSPLLVALILFAVVFAGYLATPSRGGGVTFPTKAAPPVRAGLASGPRRFRAPGESG